MKIILFLLLLALPHAAGAQVRIETDSIIPADDYSNIYVHKIAGDSLSTTFMIFIKEKVPMHKHEKHSETVVILKGTGIMILGNERMEIKEGDVIFIPLNTWHEVIVTSEIPLKVLSIQAPHFDGSDRVLYLKN